MRAGFASSLLLLATVFQLSACGAEETGDADSIAVGESRLGTPACEPGGRTRGLEDNHTCYGLRATIVGTEHADHIVGTAHTDVIVGLGGDDVIEGMGGDDVICSGSGDDLVRGGPGDDYIDSGAGSDTVFGDDGRDTIHGRMGGDWLHGGPGNDRVFGDVLDDHLFGDDGDDLIVGGHGTDEMNGGPGDDWMRGDTGNDTFNGGEGNDTASFATDRPPGQPATVGTPPVANPYNGEYVNLALGSGNAFGDGAAEDTSSIEHVIGSPFRDRLFGNGSAVLEGGYGDDYYQTTGGDQVIATFGNPTCNHVACPGIPRRAERPTTLFVYLDAHVRDTGLVVLGTLGDDDATISMACDGVHVVSNNRAPISIGPGCDFTSAAHTEVRCALTHRLNYVLAWGDNGNDIFTMGNDFPDDMTSILDGGEGNDILRGGDGQDILFGGMTGDDEMDGNEGDDALMSLSYPAEHGVQGAAYTGGSDTMRGGPGNDQLVSDYPCGAHVFSGGPGWDIVGFARSGEFDIHAQLGGPSANPMPYHGRAFNPALCPDFDRFGTRIDGDLEVLEGSQGNDILVGDDTDNTIWGRLGNDTILGQGGNDILDGLDGNDEIFGGAGQDVMSGGQGANQIHAADGEHDFEISCGAGGHADVDSHDPSPIGCH